MTLSLRLPGSGCDGDDNKRWERHKDRRVVASNKVTLNHNAHLALLTAPTWMLINAVIEDIACIRNILYRLFSSCLWHQAVSPPSIPTIFLTESTLSILQ